LIFCAFCRFGAASQLTRQRSGDGGFPVFAGHGGTISSDKARFGSASLGSPMASTWSRTRHGYVGIAEVASSINQVREGGVRRNGTMHHDANRDMRQ
jgi:hypothetical protein